MKDYKIEKETKDAYSYLINILNNDKDIILKYGGATAEEDKQKIACEIYSHFGTHYYKCINSLNDMKNNYKYNDLINNISKINILDIGCNIGTATYAYIDTLIQNISMENTIEIKIIFIEISKIRVTWLEKMFEKYRSNINKKYKNIIISYTVINEPFPVNLSTIENNLIDAPVIVLVSNFTNWNNEQQLAKDINDLYNINKTIYLLNIETCSQFKKVQSITNYMKNIKYMM